MSGREKIAWGGVLTSLLGIGTFLFGDNIVGRYIEPPNAGAALLSEAQSPEESVSSALERGRLVEAQTRTPMLELLECLTSCKGSPSDHTTIAGTLGNRTDRSVPTKSVKLNIGTIQILDAPVSLPKTCSDEWTSLHNPIVELDLDQLKVGDSVPIDLRLEVPPRHSRSFGISFVFKSTSCKTFEYFLIKGTLIVEFEGGEVIKELELSGPSASVCEQPLDYGSSSFSN